MPDKKSLKIGVTVNLENYENLRVEVEGEISEGCGPDELINYLDIVLEKFGNNDPDTKKRVDSYRRRVIRQKPEQSLTSTGKTEGNKQSLSPEEPDNTKKENAGPASNPDITATYNPGGEEKDKKTHEIRSGTDLKEEITEKSGKTENDPDKVSDIQEEILRYKENNKIVNKTTLCEICGSAVTPKAEHASKVIAGRVLCRKCLDRMKR
ncbi:hypothetical protein [Methanoplanus endosymbiosus]|uniref:Uncharacterized protein n=1 Tax=Methanoplanus endosymbiosus TaxID=33865 RepID=A0A9E7PLP6_9EURY|nr:hypothetical protein [Methanoplanus endosymbiosus]UUX91269.1 hypothetical protein L6E24_07720 [Methanoplanus endosymbiosus]